MDQLTFAARYREAARLGGACPIEAGFIGRLADHKCRHGRLPYDHRAPAAAGPRKAPPFSHAARATERPAPA